MENLKLSIGFVPYTTTKSHLRGLTAHRQYIHDLHFAHYNPHVCASGRPVDLRLSIPEARKTMLDLLSWNMNNTGLKMTLLLNYLLHDNYQVVVENVKNEFYPRGVRSFVVADIELIKRLKDALPDCEIQGSCLSNRMTEAELEEERRLGVVLLNPSVNIIREPEQLKRNHQAGYLQKIIAFEGCLHNCPDESTPFGHRWYLARNMGREKVFHCKKLDVTLDPRNFFRANWVTVSRLKTLLPYISVVKLPRGRQKSVLSITENFLRIFRTDESYNITDFLSSGYLDIINENIGAVPSHLFHDDFFTVTDNCGMKCEERGCRLCFDMMDKIKQVNGGPKRPGVLRKTYRRLRQVIRET